MAKLNGKNGVVKVGANDVINLRSWGFEETAPTIDAGVCGETFADQRVGIPSNSGTIDALLDPADTAQDAMSLGAQITLQMYPDGDVSTDTYYEVTANITSRGIAQDRGDMVSVAFGWVGSSAITENTV
ncbi:MAG: hypothetical protein OES09_00050 [Gammaproteobacteria bacterium]|nr:hypothetical protein [Gammaproteobacteria bacterium]